MARSYNMKTKQQLLSFLLLLALSYSPAAEAFSLKKFLLAPVNYVKDLAFEIAECIYFKRTL